jgi:hypothetical protein
MMRVFMCSATPIKTMSVASYDLSRLRTLVIATLSSAGVAAFLHLSHGVMPPLIFTSGQQHHHCSTLLPMHTMLLMNRVMIMMYSHLIGECD